MKITVYKTATGKIVKTLNGPSSIVNCIESDESYIIGVYNLTGYIINDAYVAKVYPYPAYPADDLRDAIGYLSLGKTIFKEALRNTGLTAVEVDAYLLTNYSLLRRLTYPDFRDFLDAKVKLDSTDSTIVAEGEAQLATYFAACNTVKATYPAS